MSITSTKGLDIWLSLGSATPTNISPTAIASGVNPAVTFDSTGMAIANGDVIAISLSGFPELDGNSYIVDSLDVTTPATSSLNLLGANVTTGTLVPGTIVANHYPATELVKLCLSSVDIAAGTSSTIDISTFCNPGASLPGNPAAGTLTFGGYTDISDLGYRELLNAESDGAARILKLDVPNQGYMLAEVTIGSVVWALPLEGSSSYTFNAAIGVPMRHLFA